MPTSAQISDLSVTLELIIKAREVPVEMPEISTFLVWDQTEFVRYVGELPDPENVLVEGACGTAACLCGTRALMDGAVVTGMNVATINGRELSHADDWNRWGAERFGIDTDSSRVLFDYQNTIRQLRYYVTQIEQGDLPLVYVSDDDLAEDGWES